MTDNAPDNGEEIPYYPKSGWSMSVGEVRKALEGLDDETEIVLDQGDCEIGEVHIEYLLPATVDHVGLITISTGQIISSEYDYHERLDDFLDNNNGRAWATLPNSQELGWKE